MFADLPPSSSTTGLRAAPAAVATRRPVAGEPTKTTLRTASWAMAASPAVGPSPASTLTSPVGRPAASPMTPSATEVTGVISLGLRTTALPVAMAGAICHPAVKTGAFQGVIWKTTPSGSRRV